MNICLYLVYKVLQGVNYVCIYDKVDEIRVLYDVGYIFGFYIWFYVDFIQLDEFGINEGKFCFCLCFCFMYLQFFLQNFLRLKMFLLRFLVLSFDIFDFFMVILMIMF